MPKKTISILKSMGLTQLAIARHLRISEAFISQIATSRDATSNEDRSMLTISNGFRQLGYSLGLQHQPIDFPTILTIHDKRPLAYFLDGYISGIICSFTDKTQKIGITKIDHGYKNGKSKTTILRHCSKNPDRAALKCQLVNSLGVYIFYDEFFLPRYVGKAKGSTKSNSLMTRLDASFYRKQQEWLPSHFSACVLDSEHINEIEAALIWHLSQVLPAAYTLFNTQLRYPKIYSPQKTRIPFWSVI